MQIHTTNLQTKREAEREKQFSIREKQYETLKRLCWRVYRKSGIPISVVLVPHRRQRLLLLVLSKREERENEKGLSGALLSHSLEYSIILCWCC